MPVKKAAAAVGEAITLPQLNIQNATIRLVADSPLIVHAWSKKAMDEMLAKQTKQAQSAKAAKKPYQDFAQSMYWLDETPMPQGRDITPQDVENARFGFPIIAFKSAAVDACSHIAGVTKVQARGAFHIDGELAEIKVDDPSDGPIMRQDMVRVGMGTADIRHRGEFRNWHVDLRIRFNANVLSIGQIVNLFNTAGFAIGVGEWRPAKDGQHGMFHVAVSEEV